jgi:hypothetical protein
MQKGFVSPPLDRPGRLRALAALMAAAILFYFCILTGATGIGAVIGVLAVLPWVGRIEQYLYSTVLSAGAAGALIGAAIGGTEEAPQPALIDNVLHFVQVIGIRAFFIGILAAGSGGVLLTAFIRQRRRGIVATRRDARILSEGVGALVWAVLYAMIGLIVIPQFSGIRGLSATRQMQSDLRNAAAAQQDFYRTLGHFADDAEFHSVYPPDREVVITIDGADRVGWTAHATHPRVTTTCHVKGLVTAPGQPPTDEIPTCIEARRWF